MISCQFIKILHYSLSGGFSVVGSGRKAYGILVYCYFYNLCDLQLFQEVLLKAIQLEVISNMPFISKTKYDGHTTLHLR